ncbi:hypothetical protein N5D52_27150 [Pseudomonas sp. GD03860]|uniref:hypothetical protein n=1 Tax=Pseudomonas sp. GD03860 TaxID=2975389 RepID=UPI00244B7856|nr:hypothetical protein [Pseudomonas sp. GD03860]MDH0640605.1 hypothetical protein [Pseudomonas sp. GD03860]
MLNTPTSTYPLSRILPNAFFPKKDAMRPLLTLVSLIGLLGSTHALAQNPTDVTAAQRPDPTSFFGVDVHGDFLTQVPACAADEVAPTALCRVATASPDQFEVLGIPRLPIHLGYKLVATVKNGSVEQLVLSGKVSQLHLVEEMLRSMLGAPSTLEQRSIEDQYGSSYQNEVQTWAGEKVSVSFQRKDSDLGQYAVTVETSPRAPETGTALAHEKTDSAGQEASHL